MIPGQFVLVCDQCRCYRRVWKKDDVDFVAVHVACNPAMGVRAVQGPYVPAGYVKN
jgi:hypothetical protein